MPCLVECREEKESQGMCWTGVGSAAGAEVQKGRELAIFWSRAGSAGVKGCVGEAMEKQDVRLGE